MSRGKKNTEKQPLMAKYNTHVRDIIIIYILSFMFLLGMASCLMTVFLNLLPSIQTGKEFIETQCNVTHHYLTIKKHVHSDTCLGLNHKIWWYPLLGQNAFYHNVVRKGNFSNNGADDPDNVIPLIADSSTTYDETYDIESTIDSFSNQYSFTVNEDENVNSGSSSSSSSSSDSSSDSFNSSESSFSSDSNSSSNGTDFYGITCFQGLFHVRYTLQDNRTITSNISGTWNTEKDWVLGYLYAYPVNGNITSKCYYQDGSVKNANWFSAPKFTISSVVLISISFVFSIVALSVDIHFIKKHRTYIVKKKFYEKQQIQQQSHHSDYSIITDPTII